MNEALVFNCHYNGLAIIQELGRHGVPVHALDSKRSIGTYSKYGKYHKCPNPETHEAEFIEFLVDHGKNLKQKAVLFPTNDHWAVAIARHRNRLDPYFFPCVAPAPVVEILIEKQRFYDWAIDRNYPVPRSWKAADVDAIPVENFPIAAKPEYRRTSGNDVAALERGKFLDSRRLTVLRSLEDVRRFKSEAGKHLPWFIFQEYVEGLSDCMITVGIYADRESKVQGIFTGRKVRGFPPDVGDCILGQSEVLPSEIIAVVKRMSADLGYQGIAEFEFKRDSITGAYKLIEINPRSWSWVGITPYCGVSLPWMAYCDLTGYAPIHYTERNTPTADVKFVKILPDLWNCMVANRQAGYPQWHLSLFDWWKSLRASKLVLAEFSADDWRPAYEAMREFLKFTCKEIKAGAYAKIKFALLSRSRIR